MGCMHHDVTVFVFNFFLTYDKRKFHSYFITTKPMLSNVITRLLNEEVQQNTHADIVELSGPIYSVQDATNKKIKTQLSEITCYNCGKKGHYKSNCPLPKKENEIGEKMVASLF